MPRASQPAYVALLRGVNVGGKNMVPMRDLAAMFEAAGCSDVTTYIQSGNVVFAASPAVAGRVAARVGGAIEERFGHRVPLVLRTAKELEVAALENPFVRAGEDPKALHAVFLADAPTAKQIASLDPQRSPGDSFEVRAREIYLRLPNGAARTKLTNDYFDKRLGTVSTMRNWRTVLTLVELAKGRPVAG